LDAPPSSLYPFLSSRKAPPEGRNCLVLFFHIASCLLTLVYVPVLPGPTAPHAPFPSSESLCSVRPLLGTIAALFDTMYPGNIVHPCMTILAVGVLHHDVVMRVAETGHAVLEMRSTSLNARRVLTDPPTARIVNNHEAFSADLRPMYRSHGPPLLRRLPGHVRSGSGRRIHRVPWAGTVHLLSSLARTSALKVTPVTPLLCCDHAHVWR